MNVHELIPRITPQKSFYKKAWITEDNATIDLKSYNTIVASYNKNNGKIIVNGVFSKTTLKHIKEFLYQLTGEKLTKKEIEKKYNKQTEPKTIFIGSYKELQDWSH